MEITYIITINPVANLALLNILIHSLNLQTNKTFNVVFYNQRKLSPQEILDFLLIKPDFNYSFYNIDCKYFIGKYPIWDLYSVHQNLFKKGKICDYVASLHMEEFLDVDYTHKILRVLEENHFDILFGNLSRTKYCYNDVKELLNTKSPEEFKNYVYTKGIDKSKHIAFNQRRPIFINYPRTIIVELRKLRDFGYRQEIIHNMKGYTKLRHYYEDVYFMSKNFVSKSNWFLDGHNLYFEDIHINWRFENHLKNIINFPVYFNLAKIYHLKHRIFWYQFADKEFSEGMLKYKSNHPILVSLKNAINKYQSGEMNIKESFDYFRKNDQEIGPIDMDYKLHMKYLSRYQSSSKQNND